MSLHFHQFPLNESNNESNVISNSLLLKKESQIYKYKEDLESERDRRSSAEWRIEKELEPRIKAEKDSYDRFVLTDTGERACESFSNLIEELIDFVEDSYNEEYMDWEEADGNLEQKILYLIKNRVDDDLYCIAEKNKW